MLDERLTRQVIRRLGERTFKISTTTTRTLATMSFHSASRPNLQLTTNDTHQACPLLPVLLHLHHLGPRRLLIPHPDRSPESNHPHPNIATSQGPTEEIKHVFVTWISQPEHRNEMRFTAGKYRDHCNLCSSQLKRFRKISSPPPPSMQHPKLWQRSQHHC